MPIGCHGIFGVSQATSRLSVCPSAFCHPVEDFFMTHDPLLYLVGYQETARKDPLIPDHSVPVPINALHLKRAYRRSQGNME